MKVLSKLKIKEAQELYKKAICVQDDKIKKIYMDKLVLGTLYVVQEHVKRNKMNLFVTGSYDMNDIVSSFTEVWIKRLYAGELLKVGSYSLVFNSTYYNDVYQSLCGDEIIVNEQFGVSHDSVVELLATYVSYRNDFVNKSFSEFVKEKYCDYGLSYEYVRMLIPLFEKIYEHLNFDKSDELDLRKRRIDKCLRLLINSGLFEPISEETLMEVNMEDALTTRMVMQSFVNDVDEVLDEKMQMVIHARYGFGDNKPQTLERVGQSLGITSARVRQIEEKSLRRLRRQTNFRKKWREFA